jgi:hypothetical protein
VKKKFLKDGEGSSERKGKVNNEYRGRKKGIKVEREE